MNTISLVKMDPPLDSIPHRNTTIMSINPAPTLPALPVELLLIILAHLDIPDLLPITRTSHLLRTLSVDPLLHLSRLRETPLLLSPKLLARPPLTDLLNARIYITRTTLAARALGRDFLRIRLNRMLSRRESAEELVRRGVLPRECYIGARGGGLAPSLVEIKRRVERELVKDVLRGWIGEWKRRGCQSRGDGEGERIDVGRMARRFARGNTGREARWGGDGRQPVREAPTRAKVLGLRRFWEKVGGQGTAG